MSDKWKIIQQHKWGDEDYDIGIKFLKNENIEYKNDKQRKTFENKIKHYKLHDNKIIVKFNENDIYEEYIYEVIKQSKREEKLMELLKDPRTTQISRDKFYDIVQNLYIGISREFVNSFLQNNYMKRQFNNTKHILANDTESVKSFRPLFPFQHWQMDIGYFRFQEEEHKEINKGFTKFLAVMDIFSKYTYVHIFQDGQPKKKGKGIKILSEHNQEFYSNEKLSTEIARFLESIFLRGDIPLKLQSDNEFEKWKAIKEVCEKYNVEFFTNPQYYNPQSTGFIENKVKQIKYLVKVHMTKHQTTQWYNVIQRVVFTINNTKQDTTKYTPLQLHKGIDPQHTVRLQSNETLGNITHFGPYDDQQNTELYYEKVKKLYERRYDDVREKINKEANKREKKTKENKRNKFSINDVVRVVRSYSAENALQVNSVYVNGKLLQKTGKIPKSSKFKTIIHEVLNYYEELFVIYKFKYPEIKKSNINVTPYAILKPLKDQKDGNLKKGFHENHKVTFKRHSADKESETFNLEHLILAEDFSKENYGTHKFSAPIEIDIDLVQESQHERQCQIENISNSNSNNNHLNFDMIGKLKEKKYDTIYNNMVKQLSESQYNNIWKLKNVHKILRMQEIILYIKDKKKMKKVKGVLGEYNPQTKKFKIIYNTFEDVFIRNDEVDLESDDETALAYLFDQGEFTNAFDEFVFRYPLLIKYLFDIGNVTINMQNAQFQ
tara:strand:- start:7377 stop:9536 length:2160 start_codon:yes stop_codon:yes gene_type:complete